MINFNFHALVSSCTGSFSEYSCMIVLKMQKRGEVFLKGTSQHLNLANSCLNYLDWKKIPKKKQKKKQTIKHSNYIAILRSVTETDWTKNRHATFGIEKRNRPLNMSSIKILSSTWIVRIWANVKISWSSFFSNFTN